jgi:hypothetical protein
MIATQPCMPKVYHGSPLISASAHALTARSFLDKEMKAKLDVLKKFWQKEVHLDLNAKMFKLQTSGFPVCGLAVKICRCYKNLRL